MSEQPVPPSRAGTPADIFISYSVKDRTFVQRLDTALESHGHTIWRYEEHVRAGSWDAKVRAAITGCPWPRIALIWPEVKSRIYRPSAS